MIAVGGFDTATWRSTGISYSVKVSSDAPADQLAHLLKAVDQVAEIPQAIRAGASVQRAGLTTRTHRKQSARTGRPSPRGMCVRSGPGCFTG